ncbi:hypothetical protein ACS0TY_027140 [Phlomoides rotata]
MTHTHVSHMNSADLYFNEQNLIVLFFRNLFSVLDCNPHLSDTKKLVAELNMSNRLFKFVRTMREKFQEAATQGLTTKGFAEIVEEMSYLSLKS